MVQIPRSPVSFAAPMMQTAGRDRTPFDSGTEEDKSTPPSEPQETRQGRRIQNKKEKRMANVLVVEDDRRVAAEIGSALAEYGFQVDEAPSGSI